MSNLQSIDTGPHLAGARLGDMIIVHSIDGEAYIMVFTALHQFGVEGHIGHSKNPIMFIPFTSILYVTKGPSNDKS